MKIFTLIRKTSSEEGTFGELYFNDDLVCYTLELPWHNNINKYSCIPLGQYTCHWIDSPKHGMCYQVMDVPNRSMIEIHSANFAGDVALGYASQLLGCIALGMGIGELDAGGGEQKAILRSRDAVKKFEDLAGGEDITLIISAVAGV